MADDSKIDWKRPQPAPKQLAELLRANFPQITQTGIYNDRNIAGTQKKSAHAEGRALDIHLSALDSEQSILGDQLFCALVRKAKLLGIDNVIWNRLIWSQDHAGLRPYIGKSAHQDIHIEFSRAGSQKIALRVIETDIAIIRSGIEDIRKSFDHTV